MKPAPAGQRGSLTTRARRVPPLAASPDEQWEQIATFVVEFRQRTTGDEVPYRSPRRHMKAGRSHRRAGWALEQPARRRLRQLRAHGGIH